MSTSVTFSMSSPSSYRYDGTSVSGQAIAGRQNSGGSNPYLAKVTLYGSTIPSTATVDSIYISFSGGSGTSSSSSKQFQFRANSATNYGSISGSTYSTIQSNTSQIEPFNLNSFTSGSTTTYAFTTSMGTNIISYLQSSGASSINFVIGPGPSDQANITYFSSISIQVNYTPYVPPTPDPSVSSLSGSGSGTGTYWTPNYMYLTAALSDISSSQTVTFKYTIGSYTYQCATKNVSSGATSATASVPVSTLNSLLIDTLTTTTSRVSVTFSASLSNGSIAYTSYTYVLNPDMLILEPASITTQEGDLVQFFYKDGNGNNHTIPSFIANTDTVKFYLLINGKDDSTRSRYKRTVSNVTLYITNHTYSMNSDDTSANYRDSKSINFSGYTNGTYNCYATVQTGCSSTDTSSWQADTETISFTIGPEGGNYFYYNMGAKASPIWKKCEVYVWDGGVWTKVRTRVDIQ
jgi:plastocyanin